MVHVAGEMQRQGFKIPLLIGGATTSKAHTAAKVAPAYQGAPTVYVTDASRAVNTTARLLSSSRSCAEFAEEISDEYAKVRRRVEARQQKRAFLALNDARDNALRADFSSYRSPRPHRLGVHEIDVELADLVPFIDWTPFFMTWELAGKYPRILEDEVVGEAARNLFRDARACLDALVANRSSRARGAYGFWRASRLGTDDIELFDTADNRLAVLHHLRQQAPKPNDEAPNYCLADFVAPPGQDDYVGGFAVTAGLGIDDLIKQHEDDDYTQIMIKALADRLAEAFAEYLHQRVRREFWGYACRETLDNDALIAEKYQGIRPAPGYPACPDHSEKQTLFKLLNVEAGTGMELTETFAMKPAASVSGWYLAHPEARYFGVGKIGRDQLEDYADRKGWSIAEAEQALRPNLAE